MVAMHLDVPEFLGVERSGCPSWLLVAAHCSALFPHSRVRNVTAVCYPSSSDGGTLAVYHPQGGLCQVRDSFYVLNFSLKTNTGGGRVCRGA